MVFHGAHGSVLFEQLGRRVGGRFCVLTALHCTGQCMVVYPVGQIEHQEGHMERVGR